MARSYTDHFRLGGVKLTFDGSPQGKTAFLTALYLTPVPGCEKHCLGTPQMSQEKVEAVVRDAQW